MDLTPIFILVAVPAVLFAGISKGGFAGGGAFIATPAIALVADPVVAVALMLPMLLLIDVTTLRAYWGRWNMRLSMALFAGAVIGIGLGAFVFAEAEPDLIRLLLGAISLGFVGFQAAKHWGFFASTPVPFRPIRAAFWGGLGGLASFISHAGGPPVAIYMLRQSLSKTEYQATMVLVFWCINVAKVPFYGALGMFPDRAPIVVLILAPIAVLGTVIGIWAHQRVSHRLCFGFTYFFLVVAGIKLIHDGLT